MLAENCHPFDDQPIGANHRKGLFVPACWSTPDVAFRLGQDQARLRALLGEGRDLPASFVRVLSIKRGLWPWCSARALADYPRPMGRSRTPHRRAREVAEPCRGHSAHYD